MIINETDYPAINAITDTNALRIVLHSTYDYDHLQVLENLIEKNIECLKISAVSMYGIEVVVKKTALKKLYGRKFLNTPAFYYTTIIPNVFIEYIKTYFDEIKNLLINTKGIDSSEANAILFNIMNRPAALSLLCTVTTADDNVFYIQL